MSTEKGWKNNRQQADPTSKREVEKTGRAARTPSSPSSLEGRLGGRLIRRIRLGINDGKILKLYIS